MADVLQGLRFEAPAPIGGGLLADVYRAMDREGPVAVKIARATPRPSLGVTGAPLWTQGVAFATGGALRWLPDAGAVIAAQAAILARLDHPAFASFVEAGVTPAGGHAYVVTRFIDGESWRAALAGGRAIGLGALLEVVRALAEVQAAGMLATHGDLKPDNLLIDGAGRARILDPSSGSTERDAMGRATSLYLTDCYNPGWVDSDQPALGLIAAEILTRTQLLLEAGDHRPARAAGPALAAYLRSAELTGRAPLFRRVLHMPLPRELDPAMPEATEAFILRALSLRRDGDALEYSEPFADLAELAGALAKLVSGRPRTPGADR